MAIDPDVQTKLDVIDATAAATLARLVQLEEAFNVGHAYPDLEPDVPPDVPPDDPPPDVPPPDPVADSWEPALPSKDGYTVAPRTGRPTEAWAPQFTITLSQPSELTLLIGELHPPNFSNPRVVNINTGTADFEAATQADTVDAFTVPADTATIVLTVTSSGDPNAALYGLSTVDADIVSVVAP